MKTFKALDKNGNGTISKEELVAGYKEIYGAKMTDDEINREVDDIMGKLDTDKSGNIDYTEWAVGTINKVDILSSEKLRKAFNLFDKVRLLHLFS